MAIELQGSYLLQSRAISVNFTVDRPRRDSGIVPIEQRACHRAAPNPQSPHWAHLPDPQLGTPSYLSLLAFSRVCAGLPDVFTEISVLEEGVLLVGKRDSASCTYCFPKLLPAPAQKSCRRKFYPFLHIFFIICNVFN